ncbi:MAG: RNA polymerase sigma factor SigJ [Bryobacteraceae bacterium]
MTAVEQFQTLRPHLFGLAYRALGSRADAEDVVQDAFLRWQSVDEQVESPKAYLTTIVSRLALDQLKSARRKREEYVGVWLPEPVMTGASPEDTVEMAESLSTAFLFVLEALGPEERVAFLLHDVFAYEYAEIAETLQTSEANARQLVSRARKHVRDRRPKFKVDPAQHRDVLQAFHGAAMRNDVGTLTGLLRQDAVLYSDGGGKASAAVNPVYGADRVARFFAGIAKKATAEVGWKIEDSGGVPSLLLSDQGAVVTLITFDLDEDGRIATVLVHRNPDKLPS